MTSISDRSIAALRATHDELAAVTSVLSDDALAGGSGASEWSVAQVLSHLGSGAEIALATLRAAAEGTPAPGQDFNHGVWDRWNAMAARDQATGFLAADAELVAAFEALPAEARAELQVTLGFLPAPLPLAAYAGMRLNEAAQHSWDVRVAVDPDAAIAADTAQLLAQHFAADLSFLLTFTGKADALSEPAVVGIAGSGYALMIADSVSIATAVTESTATLTAPLEAVMRLVAGRLSAPYTPGGVAIAGNVTLDDLRRVFPGY